jgi:hypothetical protein
MPGAAAEKGGDGTDDLGQATGTAGFTVSVSAAASTSLELA